MFEMQIDRDMYDHPGQTTTMVRPIRKYRDRPALAAGETVTIVRMSFVQEPWGLLPRVLVRTASDAERWVAGSDITPITGTNPKMYARLGEIASDMLNNGS